MRKPLFIILLFILDAGSLKAQTDTAAIYNLTTIPTDGVLLNKGWKFHLGDDTMYAMPEYDDRKWQYIDPTKDIHDIPELWKSNIVWFRLHLTADSSVLQNQLALIIYQAGASQWYLNGKLIHRFGVISKNPKQIIAYDPLGAPFSFPLTRKGEQLIAVRYALKPGLFYTTILTHQNPAFQSHVSNIDTAMAKYQKLITRLSASLAFRTGAFLILAVLHLAFYLFYPRQKANLYFCFFALCQIASNIIEPNAPSPVKYIFYYNNVELDLAQLSTFLLLTALYFLIGQKRGWIYWSLLLLIIIGMILNLFSSWASVYLISNLLNFEIVRVAVIAVKNKQRGAWIIATGAISFLVFWLTFVLGVIFSFYLIQTGSTYTVGDIIYNTASLSIPIATSIYLGLDFAFTNRSLRQKLREVEELSKQTLVQEQEKQQILSTQKERLEQEVTQRTAELQHSLEELNSTQAQLIQQEKMASLGELTAGIAHEIQNPLNFVNNFSEVSIELVDELKNEVMEGNKQEVIAIADDIAGNLQKVVTHGKRADSIVKSMMEHSRTSKGEMQPTDINVLADEYLRLAYHGMRGKDKSFNATLETHFDDRIGKIKVVPQDIGRVLLNLYNNAFYAAAERKKQSADEYSPTVSVSTKKDNDKVIISVRDNGNGIREKVKDKIFQPFFTTKPTGQGTGLGLSLSYDIIKAHSGEIKVETQEGEGSKFVVQLPMI